MPREREKTYFIMGQEVTANEIPLVFNLANVLHDFRVSLTQHGPEETHQRFTKLLKQQLQSLIQEQVILPISHRFLHDVVQDEQGIRVLDHSYPVIPDIVERAKEGWLYAKGEGKRPQTTPRFAQYFIDRYLLEYQQISSLVHDHLAKDPLFAHATLDILSQATQEVIDKNGNTTKAVVSAWYAFAMPASPMVHKGGGSYFNIYRLVIFPDGTKCVETQGYYNTFSWKKQANNLLNIDQDDHFVMKSFDEAKIMQRIIRLSENKNAIPPERLLVQIGVQSGDWFLPWKIRRAHTRLQKQQLDLENSAETLVLILEDESQYPPSPAQDRRLQDVFEAFAHPLLLGNRVPQAEILKSREEHLMKGKGRESFVQSLLGVIPNFAKPIGGNFICGMMSAGGLVKNVNTAGVHAFGGLPDNCMTCPACGNISTNGLRCSHCHFGRGDNPKTYSKRPHSTHRSSQPAHSAVENPSHGLFTLLPNSSGVGLNYLLSRQSSSTGLQHLITG